MMWRSHEEEVLDLLIDRAKILWEDTCGATLERPDASSVASFDNILAILIITFQTPFVWLRHIIKTHSSLYNYEQYNLK